MSRLFLSSCLPSFLSASLLFHVLFNYILLLRLLLCSFHLPPFLSILLFYLSPMSSPSHRDSNVSMFEMDGAVEKVRIKHSSILYSQRMFCSTTSQTIHITRSLFLHPLLPISIHNPHSIFVYLYLPVFPPSSSLCHLPNPPFYRSIYYSMSPPFFCRPNYLQLLPSLSSQSSIFSTYLPLPLNSPFCTSLSPFLSSLPLFFPPFSPLFSSLRFSSLSPFFCFLPSFLSSFFFTLIPLLGFLPSLFTWLSSFLPSSASLLHSFLPLLPFFIPSLLCFLFSFLPTYLPIYLSTFPPSFLPSFLYSFFLPFSFISFISLSLSLSLYSFVPSSFI